MIGLHLLQRDDSTFEFTKHSYVNCEVVHFHDTTVSLPNRYAEGMYKVNVKTQNCQYNYQQFTFVQRLHAKASQPGITQTKSAKLNLFQCYKRMH